MTAVYGYGTMGHPRKPNELSIPDWMLKEPYNSKCKPTKFPVAPSDPSPMNLLAGALLFWPSDFSRQTANLIGAFLRAAIERENVRDYLFPWFNLVGLSFH